MIETTNGAAGPERRGRSFLLLAAAALTFTACSTRAAGGDAEVLDTAGLLRRIESSPARVVLVNFWATWCQPCLAEMPDLVLVRGDFGAGELEILAVCMDLTSTGEDSAAKISAFAARHGIDLPIVALEDDLERAQEAFDVTALPHTIVYAAGKAHSTHQGSADRAAFAEMIRAALPPGDS